MYQTHMYEGMLAETITIPSEDKQLINAYFARPLGVGPFPRDCFDPPYARMG